MEVSCGQCHQSRRAGQPVFVHLPEPIITPTLPSKLAGSSKVEVHFTSGERLCLQGGDNAVLNHLAVDGVWATVTVRARH